MPQLKLNRPQSDSLHALRPRRTQCLPWGRGVGKSFWLRQAGHILVGQHRGKEREGALKSLRGIRIVWLMPSLKQFKAVHGALLDVEVSDDWGALGGKLNRTDYRVEYPDGSWLQPFPADLHRSSYARGLRADLVVLDEADDIERMVFESVIRPWFSEPWSLKMVLAGGTPRKGRHGLLYHLHSLGLNKEKPRYWTRHATWRDSPETVDPEEVKDAEENTPEPIFKREWLCDFDAAEGLVYGSVFDERFHVQEPPSDVRWSDVIIGGDAGWTDPGVLLLIGILGHGDDATAWVIEEVREPEQGNTWWVQQCQRLTKWYPGAKLYHDPSAPDLVNEYRKYCQVVPQKVDNRIREGVRTVADRLLIRGNGDDRRAHLYISPKCVRTIWEFGAYKNKPDSLNPDGYRDEPIDRDNHCMDALRYAIHGRFGKTQGLLVRP